MDGSWWSKAWQSIFNCLQVICPWIWYDIHISMTSIARDSNFGSFFHQGHRLESVCLNRELQRDHRDEFQGHLSIFPTLVFGKHLRPALWLKISGRTYLYYNTSNGNTLLKIVPTLQLLTYDTTTWNSRGGKAQKDVPTWWKNQIKLKHCSLRAVPPILATTLLKQGLSNTLLRWRINLTLIVAKMTFLQQLWLLPR